MNKTIILSICLLLIIGCGTTQKTIQPGSSAGIDSEQLEQLKNQAISDSTNWESHYRLAQGFIGVREYESAEKELERAINLNSLALEILMTRADLYQKMDRKIDCYSQYLKLIQTRGSEDYIPQIAEKIGQPFETTQLTEGHYNNAAASFSPDDKLLVFQSDRDGNMEIYLLELATNYVKRLTNDPGRDELPGFASNGLVITFNSTRNDTSNRPQAERMRELYMCNLEGQSLLRLTENSDDDWYPTFNPKGNEIVFVSTRDEIRDIEYSKQWSDIYLTELETRNTIRLTNSKFQNGCPVFSSKGKWIIFNANPDQKFHLYRLWLKDRKIEQLTFHEANDAAPNVNKDDNRVIFFSDINGNFDLFLLNLTTNTLQQLTSQPANEAYPRFSGDGKKIVYQAQVDKFYQLFQINLELPISKNSLVKLLEVKMDDLAHQTAKK